MTMMAALTLLNLLLLFGLASEHVASASEFTFVNRCNFTIWPGTLSGAGSALVGEGGFVLAPRASTKFTAPPGWSGRFWGRTGCKFDASGQGKCLTGDCGGALKCTAGGVPPVTLAEFTLAKTNADKDFYDVSLVDGYNLRMSIAPSGGTGGCQHVGCVADLNSSCPKELQVFDSALRSVVACKSACMAFNTPEYCCTGAFGSPQTCKPTKYSLLFKKACPSAYSYAYDDGSSTFTCSGSNYVITFCPHKLRA